MWIGMWWGGFLIIGLILFGPSLALFFFKAPEKEEFGEDESVAETNSNDLINEKTNQLVKEPLIDQNPNEMNAKKPQKRYILTDFFGLKIL